MFNLHPAIHTPDQTQLSRHAAERYADLVAVSQQRAERRGAARPRLRKIRSGRLPVDLPAES